MGAADLLQRLEAAGLRLEPGPDLTVVVAPRVLLTDGLRAEIRAHKPELIEALQKRAASPTLRETLRATITRACTARGDDEENRVALIDECLALPPAMQEDIRQHFAQVAAIWSRIK